MTSEEFRTIAQEIHGIVHPLSPLENQSTYIIKVVTSQYDEDDTPLTYEGNKVTFYSNSLKLTDTYADTGTLFIPSSLIVAIELIEA